MNLRTMKRMMIPTMMPISFSPCLMVQSEPVHHQALSGTIASASLYLTVTVPPVSVATAWAVGAHW
jgi:hypothetical protein